jgi:hypothetical protein
MFTCSPHAKVTLGECGNAVIPVMQGMTCGYATGHYRGCPEGHVRVIWGQLDKSFCRLAGPPSIPPDALTSRFAAEDGPSQRMTREKAHGRSRPAQARPHLPTAALPRRTHRPHPVQPRRNRPGRLLQPPHQRVALAPERAEPLAGRQLATAQHHGAPRDMEGCRASSSSCSARTPSARPDRQPAGTGQPARRPPPPGHVARRARFALHARPAPGGSPRTGARSSLASLWLRGRMRLWTFDGDVCSG